MRPFALLCLLACSPSAIPCRSDEAWAEAPFAGMSPQLASAVFLSCRGSVSWLWFTNPAAPSGEDALITCREEPSVWVRVSFRHPELSPRQIVIDADSVAAAYSAFDRMVAPMLIPANAGELRDSINRQLPSLLPKLSRGAYSLLDYHLPELREQLGLPPDARIATLLSLEDTLNLGRARYDVFDRRSHGFAGGVSVDPNVRWIRITWTAYLPPRPEASR